LGTLATERHREGNNPSSVTVAAMPKRVQKIFAVLALLLGATATVVESSKLTVRCIS